MASCCSTNTSTMTRCKVKRRKIHHPETPDLQQLKAGQTSIADCPQHGPKYDFAVHHGFGETRDLQKGFYQTDRLPPQNKSSTSPTQFRNFPTEASDIGLKQGNSDSSIESRSTASTVRPSNNHQHDLGKISSRKEDVLYLRSSVSIPLSNASNVFRENTDNIPLTKINFSSGDMNATPKGLQKYQWNQHNENNYLNSLDASAKKADQINYSHSGTPRNGIADSCPSSKNIFGFSRRLEERPRIENLSSGENWDIFRERSSDGKKSSRSKTGLINKMSSISNISNESSNRNLKLRSCQPKSEDLKPAQNEEAGSKATRKNTNERKGEETLNEHKSSSRIKNRLKISRSSIISICSKTHKEHKITIRGSRDKDAAMSLREPVSKHEVNKHNSISSQTFSSSSSSASDMSSVKKNQKTKIKKTESSESSSSDCIQPIERPLKKRSKRGEQRMKSNTKQGTADGRCCISQTSMYTCSCSEHDSQTKPATKDNKINCSKDLKNRKNPTKLKLLDRRHADSSSLHSDDGSTLIDVLPHDQQHEKNHHGKKVSAGVEKGEAEARAEGEKSWSLKQTLSSWAYKISGGSWSVDEKYPSSVRSKPPTSRARRENTSRETNLYEEKPSRNVCRKESKIGKRTEITESKEMCRKEMPSKTECLSCRHKKKSKKRDITEITSQTETGTVLPQLVGGGLQETKWAITQINIFKDGSKTYAIAQPSDRKPKHFSGKTDRIFVTVPHS